MSASPDLVQFGPVQRAGMMQTYTRNAGGQECVDGRIDIPYKFYIVIRLESQGKIVHLLIFIWRKCEQDKDISCGGGSLLLIGFFLLFDAGVRAGRRG